VSPSGGFTMLKWISCLIKNEKGASAIEYALIAVLIAVVIISSVAALGTKLSAKYNLIATSI
jgi:pilus assembly protein Flp/PilA